MSYVRVAYITLCIYSDVGPAEVVFADMEKKYTSARACCSILRGRATYLDVDKAQQLYQAMRQQNMPGRVL